MKGNKFLPFEKYLDECNRDFLEISFKDIEEILGEALCQSAYEHNAYWYLSKSHVFPNSWLNAGYKLIDLDLNGRKAKFIKRGIGKDSVDVVYKSKRMDSIKTQKIEETKEKENQNPLLDIDFAIEKIDKYFNEIHKDKNARYLSWEHCYKNFSQYKGKMLSEQEADFLSLHLAFYLASWGMYRGSSFLLQKDYKIHIEAVKEIYRGEYKPLCGIKCDAILLESNRNLMFILVARLKDIYINKKKNMRGCDDISEILLTKILMGTLGCFPAYDRYFKAGLKSFGVASGICSPNSLNSLAKFYENNKEKLEKQRMKISGNGVEYPPMKIIDSCFWQLGYDLG